MAQSSDVRLKLDRELSYRKITPEMVEQELAKVGKLVRLATPYIQL